MEIKTLKKRIYKNPKKRIKNTTSETGRNLFDKDEVYSFFSKHTDINSKTTVFINTNKQFNVEKLLRENSKAVINFQKMNDVRRINKFMEIINEKLVDKGLFLGSFEPKRLRKKRLLKKYVFPFNFVYYAFDFVFKRIVPKLPVTKKIYFGLTEGRNRVISKAEMLGRIYSCGFEIVDDKEIGLEHYFVARKIKKPAYDMSPTYGPFVKLRRVGKGGKVFKVYKLRTMHPYSEYIQDYIHKTNDLDKGGKFKNDFRISTLGRFFRKTWLDELPMFINFFKGEMKVVGVRPLSKHYFSLYPKSLQDYRTKFKPGLVPPFYVDMPETLDEIVESEFKYLKAYAKAPFRTDVKYFFTAFYNILIKGKRSK